MSESTIDPGADQPDARTLFETTDWAATDVGPSQGWPSELRGVVAAVLASPVPMCVFVGEKARLVYNDGYAPIAGNRHPGCFGEPVLESWSEVAEFNRSVLELVGSGKSLSFHERAFELLRHDEPETVYLNLHYSPVTDTAGKPIATLAVVEEVTDRVHTRKALDADRERLELAAEGGGLVGYWDWNVHADIVHADANFARLYDVEPADAARGVPIGSFLEAIHPDDRAALGEQIEAALESRSQLRATYRIRKPDGRIVWVLALGKVSGGDGLVPLRLPGVSIDVTGQREAQAALMESEAKFRAIADSLPQMIWSTTPDGLHDYYNARWYEFTGMPEGSTDGEGWNDVFHPDDQARAWDLWRHSLRTGENYQIEYRLRHHTGEYRWTLGRALPIRDDAGRIIRWFGTCTDIHDAKIAAQEREIIAQELSHRIKNIFSVLGSIVGLGARMRPEAGAFADDLRARIFALGTAHEFVRPRALEDGPDGHASLQGLLRALLSAYDDGAGRVEVTGAHVAISEAAATPLALAFHELATNAAKYGALKGEAGRLLVRAEPTGEGCRIVWHENFAAPVPEDDRGEMQPGFGARLLQLSVQGQMGGTMNREWTRDGLVVTIDLPGWALRRSARLDRSGQS